MACFKDSCTCCPGPCRVLSGPMFPPSLGRDAPRPARAARQVSQGVPCGPSLCRKPRRGDPAWGGDPGGQTEGWGSSAPGPPRLVQRPGLDPRDWGGRGRGAASPGGPAGRSGGGGGSPLGAQRQAGGGWSRRRRGPRRWFPRSGLGWGVAGAPDGLSVCPAPWEQDTDPRIPDGGALLTTQPWTVRPRGPRGSAGALGGGGGSSRASGLRALMATGG